MVKEPSVTHTGSSSRTVRTKTKAPSRNPVGTGKKRRPSGKKNRPKKKIRLSLPVWLNYVVMGGMAALVVIGFYYLFIRPYAYRWKPCYGTKAYGVCLPAGYTVHGFDVSHHQGDINWEELRKTQYAPFPVRFVFMKASEGGDFSDTTFIRNFNCARQYGFIRGAYHFFNPKTDAARQAAFFIRSVKTQERGKDMVRDNRATLPCKAHSVCFLQVQGALPERFDIQYLSLLDSSLLCRFGTL